MTLCGQGLPIYLLLLGVVFGAWPILKDCARRYRLSWQTQAAGQASF